MKLPMEAVLQIRSVENARDLKRYRAILASVREVGMVEPLVVHPQQNEPGTYLVDGHMRYLVLKELGKTTVECIVAMDDESCGS